MQIKLRVICGILVAMEKTNNDANKACDLLISQSMKSEPTQSISQNTNIKAQDVNRNTATTNIPSLPPISRNSSTASEEIQENETSWLHPLANNYSTNDRDPELNIVLKKEERPID
eukprot:1112983_1